MPLRPLRPRAGTFGSSTTASGGECAADRADERDEDELPARRPDSLTEGDGEEARLAFTCAV